VYYTFQPDYSIGYAYAKALCKVCNQDVYYLQSGLDFLWTKSPPWREWDLSLCRHNAEVKILLKTSFLEPLATISTVGQCLICEKDNIKVTSTCYQTKDGVYARNWLAEDKYECSVISQ
jgi:hypothetical protein